MTPLPAEHAPYGAPEVPARPAGSAVGNPAPASDASALSPFMGVSSLDSPGVCHTRASGAFSGIDATWIERDEQPYPNHDALRSVVAVIENVAPPLLLMACATGVAVLVVVNADKIAACLAGQC